MALDAPLLVLLGCQYWLWDERLKARCQVPFSPTQPQRQGGLPPQWDVLSSWHTPPVWGQGMPFTSIRMCPELPPSPPHPGPRGRISWAPETVAAARPAASGLQPQGVALLFSQPGFLSRHLGRSTGFSSLSLPASSRQSHTVQCPVAASPSPGRHPRRSGWIRDLRLGNCRMKGPGWGRGEVKMLTPLESAQL